MTGSRQKIRVMSWMLLAAGLVLTVLGTVRGEAALVLHKAIYLCLECIGLG